MACGETMCSGMVGFLSGRSAPVDLEVNLANLDTTPYVSLSISLLLKSHFHLLALVHVDEEGDVGGVHDEIGHHEGPEESGVQLTTGPYIWA